MIRQLSEPTPFVEGSAIVVRLPAPIAERSIVVVAVRRSPANAALRVSDVMGTPSRAWRCVNDAQPAYWIRQGPAGVTEICIATMDGHISGSAIAAEVAGLSPGAAVQLLADLVP